MKKIIKQSRIVESTDDLPKTLESIDIDLGKESLPDLSSVLGISKAVVPNSKMHASKLQDKPKPPKKGIKAFNEHDAPKFREPLLLKCFPIPIVLIRIVEKILCDGCTRSVKFNDIPQPPPSTSLESIEEKFDHYYNVRNFKEKKYGFALAVWMSIMRKYIFCFVASILQSGFSVLASVFFLYFIRSLDPLYTASHQNELDNLKYILPPSMQPPSIIPDFRHDNKMCWVWISTMILSKYLQIICMYWGLKRSCEQGNAVYQLLFHVLYKKSLMLAPQARKKYSSGNISVFLSFHSMMIYFAIAQYLPMLFDFIAFLIPCAILLYFILGWPSLVAIGIGCVIVITMVVSQRFVTAMEQKGVKMVGDRGKLLSEILNAIKTVKFLRLEEILMKRVQKLRRKEKIFGFVNVTLKYIIYAFGICVTPLMTCITFYIYFAIQESASASKIFAAMMFFDGIKRTVSLVPNNFKYLTSVVKYMNAIGEFLKEDECTEMNLPPDYEATSSVIIKNADFDWNKSEISAKQQPKKVEEDEKEEEELHVVFSSDSKRCVTFEDDHLIVLRKILFENVEKFSEIGSEKYKIVCEDGDTLVFVTDYPKFQEKLLQAFKTIDEQSSSDGEKTADPIENNTVSFESDGFVVTRTIKYEEIQGLTAIGDVDDLSKKYRLVCGVNWEYFTFWPNYPNFEEEISKRIGKFSTFHDEKGEEGGASEGKSSLSNISLAIKRNDVVMIIGGEGSGKTSLLSALFSDINLTKGEVHLNGNISHCPQTGALFVGSIEENILFGEHYNRKKFEEICQSVGMVDELNRLTYGQHSTVGEESVSGGQKTRISIARALYNDDEYNILILDDPLSALDSEIGKIVVQNVVMKYRGKKTVIVVTHQLQYLNCADYVVVMNSGRIVEQGEYEKLKNDKQSIVYKNLMTHTQALKETGGVDRKREFPTLEKKILDIVDDLEKPKEKFGKFKSLKEYLRSMGIWWVILSFFVYVVAQVFLSGHTVFLSKWTSGDLYTQYGDTYTSTFYCNGTNFNESSYENCTYYNFTDVDQCQSEFSYCGNASFAVWWISGYVNRDNVLRNGLSLSATIGIYGGASFLILLFVFFREMLFQTISLKASGSIHQKALKKVIGSPQQYFDIEPVGNIMTIFTSDTNTCDKSLPKMLGFVLENLFDSIGVVIVLLVSSSGLAAVMLIPFGLVLISLYFVVRKVSPTIYSMYRESLGPVMQSLAEGYNQSSTIRAFSSGKRFIGINKRHIRLTARCLFYSRVAYLWTTFKLYFVALMVTLGLMILSVIIIYYWPIFDVSTCAMIIVLSMSIPLFMERFLFGFLLSESFFNSVDRICQNIRNLKEDGSAKLEKMVEVSEDWPTNGRIEFRKFSMKYREDLKNSLKEVSFEVLPSENIAICGPSGSGKSSTFVSLFRMTEHTTGKILIDGVDIDTVPLKILRERIDIIPQRPVLFSGTLRFNLDPLGKHSDEDLWKVLRKVHMKGIIEQKGGLDCVIDEGGKNFSVGERQLLCLARTMLRKVKILVLDECTASLSMKTDELVQNVIRESFKDCTTITIAHKLNTITDSDRILVLAGGEVVEYDTPKNLLTNDDYHLFKKLIAETGQECAKHLRDEIFANNQ